MFLHIFCLYMGGVERVNNDDKKKKKHKRI